MNTKKQITADLDKLVKRAAEVKAGAAKVAAAAAEGASVKNQKVQGADAVATDPKGQKGPKGAELGEPKKEPTTSANVEKAAAAASEGASVQNQKEQGADVAATTPDGQKGPKNSELGDPKKEPTTSANVEKAAAAAGEGASVQNQKEQGSDAVATDPKGQKGPKGAELGEPKKEPLTTDKADVKVASAREFAAQLNKIAESMLSPMDKFLVKAARSHADPKVKTAAEQMPDDQLAGAASDDLMNQLATGQIGEEDAQQILQEALQSGAISEDELKEAIQMAQQAQGGEGAGPEGAPEGAAPGADTGAGPDLAGPEAGLPADAGPEAPPMGDPKMAAAQDEQTYLTKIASDHQTEMQAGEAFFNKLAELLIKSAEEAEESEKHEKSETKEEEKKEEAGLGVNLSPSDEAEKEALAAVKQELGLDDAKLAELAEATVAAPQDKLAAAKVAYRTAILSKIAALKK
jgi:hypothetical protein